MNVLDFAQGSPEWHAHRAAHFNASDAPAMLGVSTNLTRGQLLREVATGIQREFSDYVQDKIIEPGHAFEAQARALAEKIIGEDLYPCVGTNGPYSASFDGLTMDDETAWEHKRLNEALRGAMFEGCTGADLPEMYRAQMEHQTLVSGAKRVLFTASEWDGSRLIDAKHCWYTPDPDLRARIVAGWDQFQNDVVAYQPEASAPEPIAGRAPESLPALRVEVTGMVTASNLAEFKAQAMAVLGGINRDLQTDEDFANAEQTVKWCKGVEERLAATKDAVLSQTADIEAVFRTMDEVSEETRRIRLELDRLVTREKEARRAEIVAAGIATVREHYAAINATLDRHALPLPASLTAEIGAAIKGKRSLTSMRDAVDAAAASAKIAASQQADRVRANLLVLEEHTSGYETLFADRVQLCATKAPEDLRNLIAARINEHQHRERDRLERERIQQEEAERIERERAQQTPAAGVPAAQQPLDDAAHMTGVATGSRNASPSESVTRGSLPPAISSGVRIKLGDINAWIAPLSVTAKGLGSLGFEPVATDRAAYLYLAADFPVICAALSRVIADAAARAARAQAA